MNSVKPKFFAPEGDFNQISDILSRLDSFDNILNENDPEYSELDRLMIWRTISYIKYGLNNIPPEKN